MILSATSPLAAAPARPACGDFDEDGHDEIAVGLGTEPHATAQGWVALFDDSNHAHAFRRWLRLPWQSYNNAKGETRPAAGDVDGDGRDELLLAIGTYPSSGGWAVLMDDWKGSVDHANHDFDPYRWLRMQWGSYNRSNGEVWPAIEKH